MSSMYQRFLLSIHIKNSSLQKSQTVDMESDCEEDEDEDERIQLEVQCTNYKKANMEEIGI